MDSALAGDRASSGSAWWPAAPGTPPATNNDPRPTTRARDVRMARHPTDLEGRPPDADTPLGFAVTVDPCADEGPAPWRRPETKAVPTTAGPSDAAWCSGCWASGRWGSSPAPGRRAP